ncbi:MAG TPA: 5'-methylthioadenosine/S-adenosylhomocysteine nucleosidase [Microvirga sp.]|jgi:adenosylhomocysteine nucleosidase|nr:5'-methylthioadenosine/S-adenosylhomocysteine nucleosidase [Microvirga sp.]
MTPRILIAACLALALTLPAAAQGLLDPKPRIAVVTAFEPELRQTLAQVQVEAAHTVNGVTFTTGTLGGRSVVVFMSGVSMVNAAMTTQLALDRFTVTRIVVSGIAGGVDPALRIGDVVVAERWGQYLEAVFARETAEGLRPPSFAKREFPPFGMAFPQPVRVRSAGAPQGESRFWFEADPDLVAAARALAGAVPLDRCTASGPCLQNAPRLVVGGNGVSGSAFVDNAAFRDYTHRTFQATVLDMETAAIAMVAHANGRPFIAFRSLSDLAGGGPGENEMKTFLDLAADNSARVVVAFLRALGRE